MTDYPPQGKGHLVLIETVLRRTTLKEHENVEWQ
jgi:hypothetical protein